jgi:polyferredoxin
MGIAFPGTACNYLFYNVGNCGVYQVQHFLSGGIFETFPYLIMLFLAFLVMFVTIGKGWCGWTCPLGLFQDLMTSIRKKLRIKHHHVTPFQREIFAVVKYAMLFIGIVLSVIIGFNLMSYYLPIGEIYRPLCQVCPAYPMATLGQSLTSITPKIGSRHIPIWSIAIMFLFFGASLKIRRPFCRICSIGAMIGFFYKTSALSLHKDGMKCTKCGMCYRSCPMDIVEVMEETKKDDITTNDCILCMRCVELCPEEECLSGKFMGINITESSYRKFLLQHPVGIRSVLKKYATKPKKNIVSRYVGKITTKIFRKGDN